jgi:hypothetical protein
VARRLADLRPVPIPRPLQAGDRGNLLGLPDPAQHAWVARRFSISRRRGTLSFQHHAELASLPESEQDEWLDRAEKFAWSRNGLCNRLKASRTSSQNGDKVARERLNIQVNVLPDRKEHWQEAAASTEQDLLSRLVSILDEAALRVISERQEKALSAS